MKIRILLFLLLSFRAWAIDFNGTWTGFGESCSGLKCTKTRNWVQIEVQSHRLRLVECWEESSLASSSKCLHSDYEVRGESIWTKSRKIGDIFPWQMIIFEGNSQVSEQLVFKETGPSEINYHYSYSNMDGQSDWRRGNLKRSLVFLVN